MATGSEGRAYQSLTVNDLKVELRKRSASTRGRKADLIERLEAYDRNHNFTQDPVVLVEPSLPQWPSGGFRQLLESHRNLLPHITREHIDAYHRYGIADDSLPNQNQKAIIKGEKLVDAYKIAACSFVQDGDCLFFTGFVNAAMKKKVSYNYKLQIHSTRGEPQSANCECPAGRGPKATCKHIAAVLLVLSTFSSGGPLTVGRTCTDRLQKFHQPKRNYLGTPVKGELLSIQSKRREPSLDDPRPKRFRQQEGYNDFVRSTIINYVSETQEDLTIRYLYERADIQAASQDHTYAALPLTECFVDMANHITTDSATKLELETKDQAQNNTWHDERRWRITASQFGNICKATWRRNREKLAKSLYGTATFFTPAIAHGKQYEAVALRKFESLHSTTVRKAGLFVKPEYPYLGASPDGIIDDQTIVEVKCPYSGREEMITPGEKFPFLKYNVKGEIILHPTHNYFMQVQGQLFLSQSQTCMFIVYTFKDMLVIAVEKDEEYCKGSMIPKLAAFYESVYRPYVAKQLR